MIIHAYKRGRWILSLALLLLLFGTISSCATYYEKNLRFQEAFRSGDLEEANKLLDKNKKDAEGKNRLLYFMQKGVVLQMLGKFEESNLFFEKAYTFIEDYKRSYGSYALSLFSNPATQTYSGEDHEKVLIHYYKALNFLQLGDPSSALVEARRLNNKLNELNDRYEGKKNRYSNDALAHVLMALAYELDNDFNNAFIAYRNAYDAYQNLYSKEFGISAPDQLKYDLLRSAYLTGFMEDYYKYLDDFGNKYAYDPKNQTNAELVFFWHNGLGPVKGENSINFTIIKGEGGMVTFVNEEMGLNFPFPAASRSNESTGLEDLKLVRVAFPKYIERPPYFSSAQLQNNNNTLSLEKLEPVNSIAFSILQDRMLREMASSLLRLAVKQSTEEAARSQNEGVGAVLSVVNALTEKADTRNWQTLPYTIYYSRMPLKTGENEVKFTATTFTGEKTTETFTFNVTSGQTVFHIYSSLESR